MTIIAALRRPVSGRAGAVAVSLLAAFVLALAIATALNRGPWYDEMWTMWMSVPEHGIAQAARERWFRDAHPPLFYMLNRLAWPLFGEEIYTHRLINLLPVAFLAAIGLYLARRVPAMRPVLLVALPLVLANQDFGYFGEYRSYLLMLCTSTALILLLFAITEARDDLDLRRDRGFAAVIAVTILLALNIHFVGSMICGVAITLFAADRWRQGQRRWAMFLIGVTFLAALPLLAALAAERAYLKEIVPRFGARTNPVEAARFIVGVAIRSTGFNLVLMWCLLVVLIARARGEAPAAQPGARQWRFALLMFAAVAVAAAVLMGVNMLRPIVTPRYLIALTGLCVGGSAVLAAPLLLSRAWLYLSFVVLAGAATVRPQLTAMHKQNWNGGASRIAQEVRSCPATQVYGLNREDVPTWLPKSLPNDPEFIAWALRRLGTDKGFAVQIVSPPPRARPRLANGCATIVWVEHIDWQRTPVDPAGAVRVAGLSVAPSEWRAVKRIATDTGLVVILPPRPAA